jgi:hypothetical protein
LIRVPSRSTQSGSLTVTSEDVFGKFVAVVRPLGIEISMSFPGNSASCANSVKLGADIAEKQVEKLDAQNASDSNGESTPLTENYLQTKGKETGSPRSLSGWYPPPGTSPKLLLQRIV